MSLTIGLENKIEWGHNEHITRWNPNKGSVPETLCKMRHWFCAIGLGDVRFLLKINKIHNIESTVFDKFAQIYIFLL